jgi:hypothetical protein
MLQGDVREERTCCWRIGIRYDNAIGGSGQKRPASVQAAVAAPGGNAIERGEAASDGPSKSNSEEAKASPRPAVRGFAAHR